MILKEAKLGVIKISYCFISHLKRPKSDPTRLRVLHRPTLQKFIFQEHTKKLAR